MFPGRYPFFVSELLKSTFMSEKYGEQSNTLWANRMMPGRDKNATLI